MTPRPQLHASHLTTLSRCGIQFLRRYGARFGIAEKEEIVSPSIALAVGSSVHVSVERNLTHKMNIGETLPLEEVEAVAADEYEGYRLGGLFLNDEEAEDADRHIGRGKDVAVELSHIHNLMVAPTLRPMAIEHRFVLKLTGYEFDLSGQIDQVLVGGSIADVKTTKRRLSQESIATEFGTQFAMYSLARKAETGKLPTSVAVQALVKGKVPYEQVLHDVPTEAWLKPLERRIDRAAELIQIGAKAMAPADPTSWVCSPDFCGYWPTCPFGGKR